MNTCTILLLQFYGCLRFYGESDNSWKKKKYGCNFLILLSFFDLIKKILKHPIGNFAI